MDNRNRRSAPTLSVCCVTHGQVSRTTAMLSALRPIADEIVVAIDQSSVSEDLSPLLSIADVAFGLFVGPLGAERVLNWLHHQCSGDWIFRIDSDEVPSAALVDAFPQMIERTDTAQYLIPRRWCFPDPHHWLDEQPWSTDWQPRVVRNIPGLRLEAEAWHAGLVRMDPHRFVIEPIYHLDCVVTTTEEREKKAARYERLRPGHANPDGTSVNDFYLPEHHATQEPVAAPPADASLIDSVLEARSPQRRTRKSRGAAKLRRIDAREVNRLWSYRTVPESAYNASLTLLNPIPALHAGTTTSIAVRAANNGTEIWPYGDSLPAFRLAHRWHHPTEASRAREGARTMFTADVAPGDQIVQPMTLRVPDEPGDWLLQIDILHEFERWLDCGPRLPVTVLP